MMKISNSMMTLMILSIAATMTGIIVSTSLTPSVAFANHHFGANLTGQQEVPPTNSAATAEVTLVPVFPTNNTIDYYLNTTGMQQITQAHIHSGANGTNGPIIVTLFKFDPPRDQASINSNIAEVELEGPLQNKTIGDLITAMKNGSTYVNIHTVQNPDGDIRGQITGVE